jgi:hypothetical protein
MTGIRPSLIAASRRRVSFDPDAADYFARIVSAGSSISAANKIAVDVFVKGCKADGIWSAIKASCLLAGPDDLTGALVPLVGTAPTNVNFVSADYNRTTGLKGSGSNYLDSNRAENADGNSNYHLAVWVSESSTRNNGRYISGTAATHLIIRGTSTDSDPRFRSRAITLDTLTSAFVAGLIGKSRDNSLSYVARAWGTQSTITRTAGASGTANIHVFASPGGTTAGDHRAAFYSIGESLDLALLDARISTYMASIT